jgi:NTE family protein
VVQGVTELEQHARAENTVDGAARALRASPYFRGLDEASLRLLGEAARWQTFAAGELLEPGTSPAGGGRLYVLAGGLVSASTPPDPDGVAEILGDEGPGSAFGGPLAGDDDVAVYRAVEAVEAYVWEQRDLERLLAGNDELRRELGTRLSLRARRTEIVDLLHRTPLFRHSSRSAVRWLLGAATLIRAADSTVLFREGDDADSMFLIVSGAVSIFREDAPDLLRQLRRGDFFGEIALARRSTRNATAVAESACEVLVIPHDVFDLLQQRSAAFREAIASAVTMRLASDLASRPDPELVWVVNTTPRRTRDLAALVAAALREVAVPVVEPVALGPGARVAGLIEAGRSEGAAYVVCFSEGGDLADEIVDRAGGVVYFSTDAARPFRRGMALPHRVHHVVVPDGTPASLPLIRRNAYLLPLPPGAEASRLDDLPPPVRRALGRIVRAVAHRTVAVALGGGGAWGYAHVALLRGLERARVPVDMVVGASAGSLVGAFYASQGLAGLDRLVAARRELAVAALAGLVTVSSLDLFLRRHVPERRIEELPLPLATVAVEPQTGREKVFRHGPLVDAVRASCSLPGVFGRALPGADRYLDACVRNNVPVSYCTEADADFIIACDVVPAPRASAAVRRSGVRARALELFQVNRVTDTVRSLYWLASDSARIDADLADAVFTPALGEFFPWEFHRGDAIVERAEAQLEEWVAGTRARYDALGRVARVDG